MKLTEFFREELDREVERSRKVLEQAPSGKYDWKPHEKSMAFGYLADLVASMPTWLAMQIERDDLDVAPEPGKSEFKQVKKETSEELVKALDEAAAKARAALEKTTDEHLNTNWKLLARGQVVMEAPRYLMIQNTLSHWSHHRGQMTVYLRLLDAKVPAIFGPSADDKSFG
jgi:uncharacterized damage-inducible protein DinB